MVVLERGAVSYERGTPVTRWLTPPGRPRQRATLVGAPFATEGVAYIYIYIHMNARGVAPGPTATRQLSGVDRVTKERREDRGQLSVQCSVLVNNKRLMFNTKSQTSAPNSAPHKEQRPRSRGRTGDSSVLMGSSVLLIGMKGSTVLSAATRGGPSARQTPATC